jgi:hypothetical protein
MLHFEAFKDIKSFDFWLNTNIIIEVTFFYTFGLQNF